ncbi:MAG: Gfo/Idh/MocA family oxidoreductase [Phycisphaerae bacterium]|nr:Gfo/Idh/MocA family oxidoreductase [Phycisphaerae bacterium]
MKKVCLGLLVLTVCNGCFASQEIQTAPSGRVPLRVGVVGLVHDHVGGILGRAKDGDIKIVGIAEANLDLARRYSQRYGFDMGMVYPSIEAMIDAVHPEAVTAFNPIFDHLHTVAVCAPKGIHVMVEKPLAVDWDHARKMAALADAYDIHLLTNYETTWYGSTQEAYRIVHEDPRIGDITKIVFHTGHRGPIEIGCRKEFTDWLTDPILNGAGALNDFGCYGANLATWLMKGAAPVTVSCVTQQIKPDVYPRVDDEATIVLAYPRAQVIIQASWNWPYNRKDMTVYGKSGYVFCKNGQDMEILTSGKQVPVSKKAAPLAQGSDDPFTFLANVVRGRVTVPLFDLSSLDNNIIAMRILDAAKHAAETGQTVVWESDEASQF